MSVQVPTVITYPNGSSLSSTALTQPQINILIQALTCGMIGINPPDDSLVRVDWQQEGQPFAVTPSQDVCFLSCVPQDSEYSRVRDRSETGTGTPYAVNFVYTRNWRVSWCFYGPNGFDRARQLHTGTFLDWVNNMLSLSLLYPVSDPPEPVYAPETFNAQWWQRTDFHIDMYEQINETLTVPTGGVVTNVEVKVYDGSPTDPVADFTVVKP